MLISSLQSFYLPPLLIFYFNFVLDLFPITSIFVKKIMYDIIVHSAFVPQDFLELAGRWATLQSNAVVKLYGVTLSSPLAMVTEYLSLGPLDVYLKEHKLSLKQVDLVEAGAFLARALWHLVCVVGVKHNLNCCVI
jgi:hypothetical protein